MRFKIADLMILIIPAAAFSYALSRNLEFVGHFVYTAYLALLAVATLGAKFTSGDKSTKMFCKGAAVFGWVYLIFGLNFGIGAYQVSIELPINGMLFAALAGYAARRLVPRRSSTPGAPGMGGGPARPDVEFNPGDA